MNENRYKLFIISSPSGGGKTSLIKSIFEDSRANTLWVSVSHTTRQKRKGDLEGKDYFFINDKDFKEKINKGDFLEYAKVFENYYGTDKNLIDLKLNSHNVFLEIDWQGTKNIKKIFPDSLSIFLLPPSYKDLEDRLIERGLDSEETIIKRLAGAKLEISKSLKSDYLVLNDDFEKALEELKTIVFQRKSPSIFKSRASSELINNLLA